MQLVIKYGLYRFFLWKKILFGKRIEDMIN